MTYLRTQFHTHFSTDHHACLLAGVRHGILSHSRTVALRGRFEDMKQTSHVSYTADVACICLPHASAILTLHLARLSRLIVHKEPIHPLYISLIVFDCLSVFDKWSVDWSLQEIFRVISCDFLEEGPGTKIANGIDAITINSISYFYTESYMEKL